MFLMCHEKGRIELKSEQHPPNSTIEITKKEFLIVTLLLDHFNEKLWALEDRISTIGRNV